MSEELSFVRQRWRGSFLLKVLVTEVYRYDYDALVATNKTFSS
jgi:hypothetical protein